MLPKFLDSPLLVSFRFGGKCRSSASKHCRMSSLRMTSPFSQGLSHSRDLLLSRVCSHAHMHAHTRTHTGTQPFMHALMRACTTHARVHVRAHTHMHPHMRTEFQRGTQVQSLTPTPQPPTPPTLFP